MAATTDHGRSTCATARVLDTDSFCTGSSALRCYPAVGHTQYAATAHPTSTPLARDSGRTSINSAPRGAEPADAARVRRRFRFRDHLVDTHDAQFVPLYGLAMESDHSTR